MVPANTRKLGPHAFSLDCYQWFFAALVYKAHFSVRIGRSELKQEFTLLEVEALQKVAPPRWHMRGDKYKYKFKTGGMRR